MMCFFGSGVYGSVMYGCVNRQCDLPRNVCSERERERE